MLRFSRRGFSLSRWALVNTSLIERNNPLVGAPAPGALLGEVKLLHISAVNESINVGQKPALFHVLKGPSGPRPDGFLWEPFLNALEEPGQNCFVLGLKRVAAQQRKTGNPF